VAGLEIFRLGARAAVQIDQPRPEEEHDSPGQQSILEPREIDTGLAPLPEQAEQVLVVGTVADGELLTSGRLLEQVIEAVHRRRSFRGFDDDAVAAARSDVSPG